MVHSKISDTYYKVGTEASIRISHQKLYIRRVSTGTGSTRYKFIIISKEIATKQCELYFMLLLLTGIYHKYVVGEISQISTRIAFECRFLQLILFLTETTFHHCHKYS